MLVIDLIPCLTDNYAVLLSLNGTSVLIDAPEAEPIVRAIQARGTKLEHILITHHHHDHVAGLGALKDAFAPRIHGNRADASRIALLSDLFNAGEPVKCGALQFQTFDTPGHTVGHAAFYCAEHGLLFAGDTLFSGGCGRLFEGSAAQMFQSLQQLNNLPADTRLYCGHEYTLSNLRFAVAQEPNNVSYQQRLGAVEALRAKGLPSLPSTLAVERQSNIFLRAETAEELARLRELKNRF